MEKKKTRNVSDDLCIVKAAAWAWYEHGSGSEGKPMREFDATTTLLIRPHYKPSRYKMEAMKIITREPNLDQEYCSTSLTSNAPTRDEYSKDRHSLLDAYEVESISKQLDYLILSNSNRFDNKDVDLSKKKSSELLVKNNPKKQKSLLKAIWSRHSVICGTRDDVVSRALVRTRPLPITTGSRVPRDTRIN